MHAGTPVCRAVQTRVAEYDDWRDTRPYCTNLPAFYRAVRPCAPACCTSRSGAGLCAPSMSQRATAEQTGRPCWARTRALLNRRSRGRQDSHPARIVVPEAGVRAGLRSRPSPS